MLKLIWIIIMCVITLFAGIVFPVMTNTRFKNRYGKKGWSMLHAILQGGALALFLYEKGNARRFGIILAGILLGFCYIASVLSCVMNVRQLQAHGRDCLMAVLAQILAPIAAPAYLTVYVFSLILVSKR